MNRFQLTGRLTREPEKRITSSQLEVSNYTIAVNRKYVAEGQERQADFFNVVAYGKIAEFCNKYFKKGKKVLVEGRMQNRTWEDQNGQKRYITDYIVENCEFADGITEEEKKRNKEENDFITVGDEEELPF